ncbi:MAG: Ribosomal protein L11 methyltransferase [Promethearchaeota archaeon]|nr:MAG: Ribosomal protein L11 methyltransferase [Candidatus Lokiarchaeota archaeon]
MEISKKDLIALIQETEPFRNPKIDLEQYTIDAKCAIDIIYIAGVEFDDIRDQIILDFGTGTGRLSLSAALFNPKKVISVDIDINALKILRKNVNLLNLKNEIEPICADISQFEVDISYLKDTKKITTIMNPPFGVQKKRADRIFLTKAFSLSDVIYSIHVDNEKVTKFISRFAMKHGWRVDFIFPFNMVLVRSFWFHTKKRKAIDVNLFRFIKI